MTRATDTTRIGTATLTAATLAISPRHPAHLLMIPAEHERVFVRATVAPTTDTRTDLSGNLSGFRASAIRGEHAAIVRPWGHLRHVERST